MRFYFGFILLMLTFTSSFGWGFYAHKLINRMAIATLPAPMSRFYKQHISIIERWAVLPDQRRYAIPEEACRHFLDFEAYDSIPLTYEVAIKLYSEDTLRRHGALPWNIQRVYYMLRNAFERKDQHAILKYSAELGHDIADAHVPLHTTHNYNGQLTGQHGIHGLWESRLPELFQARYNYHTGPARYVKNIALYSRELVFDTHQYVENVLATELMVRKKIPESKWFEYVQRGTQLVRQYSVLYSKLYHQQLNGMVEKQLKKSIHSVGSLWYSAWIEAGQPNLLNMEQTILEEDPEEEKPSDAPHDCKH